MILYTIGFIWTRLTPLLGHGMKKILLYYRGFYAMISDNI